MAQITQAKQHESQDEVIALDILCRNQSFQKHDEQYGPLGSLRFAF
jgi:hypothetical protein